MDLYLKGRMTLSRDVKIDDLDAFFRDANEFVLSRGAPEGKGARVVGHRLEGNTLHLEIESHEYVRAHDALLRIKNAFARQYGRSHRIGIRAIHIDDYRIDFEVPRPPLKEIAIPFARVSFDRTRVSLMLESVNEEFLQQNYVDRMISLVREKIEAQYYEGKAEYWELMWSSPPREIKWTLDPTEEMIKLGWIKHGPTKGKWFLRPQAAAIFRAMEEIAVKEILRPLGFQEVVEPHHVSFDIWLRTGHMEGSPNEFYYVYEPKTRDPDAWERFRDLVKITRDVPQDELERLLKPSMAGICYAQCPTIYWSLQNSTIAMESLPLLIFDRAANSNRYESGGRHGIERVDEFHRIEPVFIGSPEQCVEIRDRLVERYKHVFNDILELEWRMAWVTPFYMQQAGEVGIEEGIEKVKGTIDFEAYMPYRGPREEAEWLEFQNLTIVGSKFIKAFNIKPQRGELWSGCSGIGLERWTAAFLAQHTLDPDNWPGGFKDYLSELPEGIKLL